MQNSSIEWTDHTFNPWWGCQRVSPGCEHCYAETLAKRYNFRVWGPAKTTERREMSANYWLQPLKWDKAAKDAGKRARVFCASMADVFEDHPQLDWPRTNLWGLIETTPHLDWLLLTKRPENILRMLPPLWNGRTPDNVWLGTSVESQEYADKRIPELLKVPAAVRFLSCEPLLGPVDLSQWLICEQCNGDGTIFHIVQRGRKTFSGHTIPCPKCKGNVWRRDIHWVIAGGESGPGARPMHPDWAYALRDDCQNAGIKFFFKQWGEYGQPQHHTPGGRVQLWCAGGTARTVEITKLGKHAAGRLLDGREWNEVPV